MNTDYFYLTPLYHFPEKRGTGWVYMPKTKRLISRPSTIFRTYGVNKGAKTLRIFGTRISKLNGLKRDTDSHGLRNLFSLFPLSAKLEERNHPFGIFQQSLNIRVYLCSSASYDSSYFSTFKGGELEPIHDAAIETCEYERQDMKKPFKGYGDRSLYQTDNDKQTG